MALNCAPSRILDRSKQLTPVLVGEGQLPEFTRQKRFFWAERSSVERI
jgi:hypothetical protein